MNIKRLRLKKVYEGQEGLIWWLPTQQVTFEAIVIKAKVPRSLTRRLCSGVEVMFGWSRQPPKPAPPPEPGEMPSFRPSGAKLLSAAVEVQATLAQQRAVVYITVEWAGYERHSRLAFVEFMRRIADECPGLGISFHVLSEYSEGVAEWFEAVELPTSAATGYGAVAWLERGRVVAWAPYAAQVGVPGLLGRTIELWGRAEPSVAPDGAAIPAPPE